MRPGIILDGEADVTAAVAEEGSRYFAAKGRGYREVGWEVQPFTSCGDYIGKSYYFEKGTKEGRETGINIMETLYGRTWE